MPTNNTMSIDEIFKPFEEDYPQFESEMEQIKQALNTLMLEATVKELESLMIDDWGKPLPLTKILHEGTILQARIVNRIKQLATAQRKYGGNKG